MPQCGNFVVIAGNMGFVILCEGEERLQPKANMGLCMRKSMCMCLCTIKIALQSAWRARFRSGRLVAGSIPYNFPNDSFARGSSLYLPFENASLT